MYLDSFKISMKKSLATVLFWALFFSPISYADQLLSLHSRGRDLSDAVARAVRMGAGQLRDNGLDQQQINKILETEIVPNAAQFISTYKVVDSRAGSVNMEAKVNVDALQALLNLSANTFKDSSAASTKSLILVDANVLLEANAKKNIAPDFFSREIVSLAKERMQRRGFQPIVLSDDSPIANQIQLHENINSPEFTRAMAIKDSAQLALSIWVAREVVENEHSHSDETRYFFHAHLIDVKKNNVLAKYDVSMPIPWGGEEHVKQETLRGAKEKTEELLQELFVRAGKYISSHYVDRDFFLVRVANPPSAKILSDFRTQMRGLREVRSVMDRKISKGSYDFAVKSTVDVSLLGAKIQAIASDEYSSRVRRASELQENTVDLIVFLKLKNTERMNDEEK